MILTILFACLIFPIFFMCCDWWKKIVSPFYEISFQTYQTLARIINQNSTINYLNLTVVDNALDAQKINLLR
jgi:hypothetical protein